jgi:hypothetical protein
LKLDYNTSRERGIYFSPTSPGWDDLAWECSYRPGIVEYIWFMEGIHGGERTYIFGLFIDYVGGDRLPAMAYL